MITGVLNSQIFPDVALSLYFYKLVRKILLSLPDC